MQRVPITNDARQTFLTALNGVTVRITIWYQAIGESWYMRLEFADGTVITQGAKLGSGRSVLSGIINDFGGHLVVVPVQSPAQNIGRRPWNNTHELIFMTTEEARSAGIEAI